jgi:alkylhydroperoxidase family enzyme
MARVPDVEISSVDPSIRAVLEAQRRKWGAPLLNHLIYARRPTIFRGVRGMWGGIDQSRLIDPQLQALVNRRVAYLNGCEFWQDLNAAVGSALGVPDEKLLALNDYATSPLFSDTERMALEYADAMTITGRDVSDELFDRLRGRFDDDAIVELTEIVAWENASAKFNRALRIPSQKLWMKK